MSDEVKKLPRFGGDRYLLPLVLLAIADAVVFAGGIWLAYWVRFHTIVLDWFPLQPGWTAPGFGAFFKFGLLAAFIGLIVFERLGFYRERVGMDRRVHILRILIGVFLANLALQILLTLTDQSVSRGTRLIAFLLTVPLAVGVHYFLKRAHLSMISEGWGFRKTLLVVSKPADIERMLSEIEADRGSEFQVTGVLVEKETETALGELDRPPIKSPPVLGGLTDLRRTLATGRFDTVFIDLDPDPLDRVHRVLENCERFGMDFFLNASLFEAILAKMPVGGKMTLPVLALGETTLSGSAIVLKRAVDLAGSGILILICLPFWVLLSILIKLDSKGPIFYSQERVGHDGRTFRVFKFRTMHENAEGETGPVWAKKDDERRTRLGRVLRRLNLDETPQFLNVFRGEMSLVGPRPERPHFVNQFKRRIPRYLRRHIVKSGLTGWAQVNGLRGDTSIEERTKYDIWYIENWSLWLDFKILLRTIKAIENAH